MYRLHSMQPNFSIRILLLYELYVYCMTKVKFLSIYFIRGMNFTIGTQQDSHEVMRFFLQNLKTEEIQVGNDKLSIRRPVPSTVCF